MSEFRRNLPARGTYISINYRQDTALLDAPTQQFRKQLANELAQRLGVAPQFTSNHYHLIIPGSFGTGSIRHLFVRPGLEIELIDLSLTQMLYAQGNSMPTSYFQLGFWEVGRGIQVRADFQSGVGVLQPNQAFLSRTPISYATESLFPKDERLQGVNVYIAPALLQSWLSDYPLPDHMQKALFHDPSQILVHSTHITALIGHCLKQLRHITPDDPMFRLYTEGKVMEIVALYVDSMLKPEALTQAALTAEDVACIHRAKDILLAQLDDPPSLLQLARAVHINDYKLKVGFKSLFGTTVFGMLYDYRMEKAREMIKRNRDSIAEIAEQVGYKSPKAFATAFKRKYGITPREARS